jgi:hypothetical protein
VLVPSLSGCVMELGWAGTPAAGEHCLLFIVEGAARNGIFPF